MSTTARNSQDWDKNATSFLKEICEALKTREAVEVGTKAVEYFRGADYATYVEAHAAEITKRHQELCEAAGGATPAALGQYLLSHGLIAKAEHAPLPGLDQSLLPAHLRDSARWPRRLKIARDQSFTPEHFYAINYEASSPYSLAMLGGTIAVVLIFCMFPIWPFAAKICTWYLAMILMTLLLICIVMRLVLFVALWYCGRDFWFLPNLFDEDAGVIESFIPLYSYKKRDDGWMMVAVRAFAAVLTAASFYKLSETHSLGDISEVGVNAFLDILEWGHTKLGGNTTAVTASNVDALLSPAEKRSRNWELCVKHCEFQDVEEFQEFCLNDCPCLNELWQSRCWRACDFDIRDELKAKVKDCKDTGGDAPSTKTKIIEDTEEPVDAVPIEEGGEEEEEEPVYDNDEAPAGASEPDGRAEEL